MTYSMMLILFISSISLASAEQNKNETTTQTPTKEVIEQPTIVVIDESTELPAPLQQEVNRINNWSGAAALLTSDAWENQRATNIKDVLDFIPGVFAQQRNGAESARISIRGSGLGRQFQGGGLLLLQDGVPLNTADGSFDFQAVDPWLIDYVTVYRGANGMASGGSTLGGVINLGSTLPTQDSSRQHNNQFRFAAGSFSTRRAMTEINANLKDENQAIRLRASHFNQAGFRVQNEQNSNRFDLQYANKSPSDLQHRWGLYHLNTLAELPSTLSQALINADPRQSRGFNINGNFNRDLTLTRLSYQLAETSSSQTQWSATFFITARRLENPVFTYINRDSDDAGINFNWQHGPHSVAINAQWGNQDELRRENEGGVAGNIRLSRDHKARTITSSYQFQHDLVNKPLSLIFGLQGTHAKRDITEIFPQLIISDRSYSQINPRIGLLYAPDENTQWFTNLSHSFEPPTFSELNNGNQPGINLPVKAQSANSFEIGTRGFTENLNWDISLYYSQLNNEFIRFTFPDGNTSTTNADNSIHWGLESAIQWNIAKSIFTNDDHLSLENSYHYNKFQLDDDPTFGDNNIPGVPEHYLQSRLSYRHPSGWSINPNIEWVPTAYFVDLANSFRTENYLLTGLSINYKTHNGIEFYFDAKNLNDQTYISTTLPIPDAGGIDGNYFYSGEGRAFYAGLKLNF